MKQIRLDKYIAESVNITRSTARQWIKKGRVKVDGQVERKPDRKVSPEDAKGEEIRLDGERLTYEEMEYIMLNKPQGVVSATEDHRDQTVIDLIKEPHKNIFPVGRLDKDTEGLLLLTNDGELAHQLLSPKKHVDKCYYARLDGPVGEKEIKGFAEGLDIGEEKKTLPAILKAAPGESNGVYITIQEGKFHQVKRMAKAVGREVLFLKRLTMGSLRLDETLKPGQYRRLTSQELEKLKKR